MVLRPHSVTEVLAITLQGEVKESGQALPEVKRHPPGKLGFLR